MGTASSCSHCCVLTLPVGPLYVIDKTKRITGFVATTVLVYLGPRKKQSWMPPTCVAFILFVLFSVVETHASGANQYILVVSGGIKLTPAKVSASAWIHELQTIARRTPRRHHTEKNME